MLLTEAGETDNVNMKNMNKHKSNVQKVITAKSLTSLMNNTKWQKLIYAIKHELKFPPPYSRKDVLENKYESFNNDVWCLGDYDEGIYPFYSIEWIEIRPRRLIHQGMLIEDKIESIEESFINILVKLKIPYKTKNGSYFIYGYTSDFSNFEND